MTLLQNKKFQKVCAVFLLVVIALLSIFVFAKTAASPEAHSANIEYLDSKKQSVLTLAAVSTAASTAITLTPGDIGTPIADKLADLSGYFLLALVALNLEKYLLTITGSAAFLYLIPAACAILIVYILTSKKQLAQIGVKLALFALCIFCIIPVSIKTSQLIENTYTLVTEDPVEYVNDLNEFIRESEESIPEEGSTEVPEEETGSVSDPRSGGFFRMVAEWAREAISDTVESLSENVTEAVAKMEAVLNDLIEKLAVIIVTSCLIPLLVFLFFFWLVRMILGVDYEGGRGKRLALPRLSAVQEKLAPAEGPEDSSKTEETVPEEQSEL